MIELDFPGEVRKSEELNNLNLSFYLKKKLGSSNRPLLINQFKKGFSNLTLMRKIGVATAFIPG